ncbi:MAG: alpha/beta hydrolase [Streptosporangiaceae bacterium]
MTACGHEGITGVTFASDGDRLIGVLYLAQGDAPKPTVLLLHGCPGLEQNLDIAMALRDSGWNCLVFHYRGCWGSAGRYDLRTIARDVRAATDYLQATEYPGVDPGRLAVAGHSLGGWAAILAAAADQRLRAVVAIAAPAELSLASADSGNLDREFTRFLAVTPTELRRQAAEVSSRPSAADVIPAISPRPLLLVHGSADEWIPAGASRLLYERAGQPRRYVEIDGANHAFAWHRAALRDLVTGWLTETGV